MMQLGLKIIILAKKFDYRCFIGSKYSPNGNDMFNANNRNTRKRCEICSKLTIKTPESRH